MITRTRYVIVFFFTYRTNYAIFRNISLKIYKSNVKNLPKKLQITKSVCIPLAINCFKKLYL